MPQARKRGTRERILNAAEKAFALHGYNDASIRDITKSSGTTIGSFLHFFKTKENLLREVILRRYEPLLAERTRAFEEIMQASGPNPPPLSRILDAIVSPLLRIALTGTEPWRNYIIILLRISFIERVHEKRFARVFDPFMIQLIELIQRSLPDPTVRSAGFAAHFVMGCLMYVCGTARMGRLEAITNGACAEDDFEGVREHLLAFLEAGVRACIQQGDRTVPVLPCGINGFTATVEARDCSGPR